MPSGPKSSHARAGEVEIGFVSGVFGVAGEVRLHLHNRESGLLSDARDVVLVHEDGRRVPSRLKGRPGAGKRVLGRLDGVTDRDAAREWIGWRIVVDRDVFPTPEPGEFYLIDVVGLPVWVDGEPVGEVADVHSTGPTDILEVSVEGGARYVPMLAELVSVDVDAGRVEVKPGALDEV